jgi:hypothetical protein
MDGGSRVRPGRLSLCALAAAAQEAVPPPPTPPQQQQQQQQQRFSGFRDPQDGRLDLSQWLLERKGVLPVPLIITEPALGVGFGVMGLYFRESMQERSEKARVTGRLTPPGHLCAGRLPAPTNGTRGAVGGGMLTSDDGRFRWRGRRRPHGRQISTSSLGGRDRPLAFNLQGWASVQHAMMRLGEGDACWWTLELLRPAKTASARRNRPPASADRPGEPLLGLGVSLEFDSRDKIFTPSRGMKGSVDMTFYAPGLGSDQSFQTYRAYGFGYWPVSPTLVLAGRADARSSGGTVPFYCCPSSTCAACR